MRRPWRGAASISPHAKVSVNDDDPPLPFADNTFGLIFNHSVFTHIDEQRQDAWLTELHRVTRPGGLLILSIHGEIALGTHGEVARDALGEEIGSIRMRLENEGIVFIDGVQAADCPLPDWYQHTYHAPWYLFEHWGKWFEIRSYVPGAALGLQDHVLFERAPNGATPRPPLAARPAEPSTGSSVGELEAQIAAMRSMAAWRWATRYWKIKGRLNKRGQENAR
jgi:SAM-dependent methyltransferase